MTIQNSVAGTARPAETLPYPGGVLPLQIEWTYAIPVIIYHLVALLALLPWFFSWTGVFLAVAGLYVFGTLGINLCYHRLLAHRGLIVPNLARAYVCDSGGLQLSGYAGPLGSGAPPPSSARG